MRITNEVLAQMITDVKENLEEVKCHVKETNGKVAQAHIDIAKLQVNQKNLEDSKTETKEWVRWIPTLAATIIMLVTTFIR